MPGQKRINAKSFDSLRNSHIKQCQEGTGWNSKYLIWASYFVSLAKVLDLFTIKISMYLFNPIDHCRSNIGYLFKHYICCNQSFWNPSLTKVLLTRPWSRLSRALWLVHHLYCLGCCCCLLLRISCTECLTHSCVTAFCFQRSVGSLCIIWWIIHVHLV